jgi:hypothetical protein
LGKSRPPRDNDLYRWAHMSCGPVMTAVAPKAAVTRPSRYGRVFTRSRPRKDGCPRRCPSRTGPAGDRTSALSKVQGEQKRSSPG